MDFPLFYLDVMGNRLLLAVVAIVHVLVNHPLAVGAYPLVVVLEWWGWKRGDRRIDELARRATFVLFIVTTTVGALTGVGIWFTAALISPFSIGSLLRVFFWAWFVEWLVFVSEVVLVLVYYLLWRKWTEEGKKVRHIAVGVALAVMSWFTMVIITGILSFMMESGVWTSSQEFWDGFLNPIYGPQLFFRTFIAFALAGLFVWFLLFFFTRKEPGVKKPAVRFVAVWTLIWSIPAGLAALWYRSRVPDAMLARSDVALLTQDFQHWYDTALIIIAAAIGVMLLTVLIGALRPKLLPRVALLIPFVLGIWLMGHFERVREFIRKPWVIADYMYSNGIRKDAMPIYQRDGILPYAAYVSHRKVTPGNRIGAGRDVYRIACSRCHTTDGLNGVLGKFTNLYGEEAWDDASLRAFIKTMHVSRTYMPPFPGSDEEAEALIAWVKDLRTTREDLHGAQMIGIPRPAREPSEIQTREEVLLP